ncbi:inositol monophosphatase family protein [Pseudomonas sp. RHF3.3-3]|uniref:D-fructose 1,6-bisphosphatase n=1 Tax=Pseudomonas asplenii TaxID=53407 RepID=A0A0N0E1Z2_9PSED|nr:inositol monophosphatase family protein [Pseudomonas fuscovaginae]KPA88272.1 D-fructose 1,6-bisphosphatase [Pseudomonas fuscovaginae]
MRPLFGAAHIFELERCLYEARKKLRRYWAGTLARLPSFAGGEDLTGQQTKYDLECQSLIFESFSNIGMRVTIFSEEIDSSITFGEGGEFYLIVDPLDGTHNAILGFPAYTSSVALYHEGAYIFGWVYDMSRDIVYTASLGEGAYLQSPIVVKRLRTRNVYRLDEMRIAFHRPEGGVERALIEGMLWAVDKVRVCSCSSLEICLIAAGVLDAFIDIDNPGHERSCDIAAAELILREAGGTLFDMFGNPRFSLPPSTASLSDRGTLVALSSKELMQFIAFN